MVSHIGSIGTVPPPTLKRARLALAATESTDMLRKKHHLVTLFAERCGCRTHLPIVQAQGFIQVGHHMDRQQVPQQRLSLQVLERQCRLCFC